MPSTLREQLIRLAHARPDLRPHVLPILKAAGGLTKKDFNVFAAETYFPAEAQVVDMVRSRPARIYLTDAEGKQAAKNLDDALKAADSWADKYEAAIKAGSGDLFDTVMRATEYEKYPTPQAWLEGLREKTGKARRAKSLADVAAKYAPVYGPAYSDKFGGMLLEGGTGLPSGKGPLARAARWRAVVVADLQKDKDLKELALFTATGAKLDDLPELTEGVADTVKAVRLLKSKYDDAATAGKEAAVKALKEAVDEARASVAKRYPKVDVPGLAMKVYRPALRDDCIVWLPDLS